MVENFEWRRRKRMEKQNLYMLLYYEINFNLKVKVLKYIVQLNIYYWMEKHLIEIDERIMEEIYT